MLLHLSQIARSKKIIPQIGGFPPDGKTLGEDQIADSCYVGSARPDANGDFGERGLCQVRIWTSRAGFERERCGEVELAGGGHHGIEPRTFKGQALGWECRRSMLTGLYKASLLVEVGSAQTSRTTP